MITAGAKLPLLFDVDDVVDIAATGESETPLSRLFALCNVEQQQEFVPERRSFRIHGHSTTIRLERAYWTVLELLAGEENMTVSSLVTRIHDHCQIANEKNLASCLRVVCLKFINVCT